MEATGKLLAGFALAGYRVFAPPGRTGSSFVAMAAAAVVAWSPQPASAKHVASHAPPHARSVSSESSAHSDHRERHAGHRTASTPASQVDRSMHAIARGAHDGGANPAFMLGVAWMESGLDPVALNHRSTAKGPLQFTRMSWIDAVWEHGSKHGLGAIVDGMDKSSDGTFVIAPRVRKSLMQAREDPYKSSVMAAEVFRAKASSVERSLGRKLQPCDGYLILFLGRDGAARFLAADPSASAASVAPEAVFRNPELFRTDKGVGRVRTIDEVRVEVAQRLSAAMARFPGVPGHRADAGARDADPDTHSIPGWSPT